MPQPAPFPIRKECPPGACICERESLLLTPDADIRILRLTREEEKKLLARIDSIANYAELKHLEQRMYEQLGIVVRITPSIHGVRTVRGLSIRLQELPGLCRKTRQSVPAAIRRCLDQHPDIVYAILNAHDLLVDG